MALHEIHGYYAIVAREEPADRLRTDDDDAAVVRWLALHHAPCPRCGQDLHGAGNPRCAECGLEVGIARRDWLNVRGELRIALWLTAIGAWPHVAIGLVISGRSVLLGMLAVTAGAVPTMAVAAARAGRGRLAESRPTTLAVLGELGAISVVLIWVFPFVVALAATVAGAGAAAACCAAGAIVVGVAVLRQISPDLARGAELFVLAWGLWGLLFLFWLLGAGISLA